MKSNAPSVRTVLSLIAGLFCAAAGYMAAEAPEGALQQGAHTAATACEAAGVPAFPRQAPTTPGQQ